MDAVDDRVQEVAGKSLPTMRGMLGLNGLLSTAAGVRMLYVIGGYAGALGTLAPFGAVCRPVDGGDTLLILLGGAIVTLAVVAAFALATGSPRWLSRSTEDDCSTAGRRRRSARPRRTATRPFWTT
jgi:hypothetical protein